MSPPGSGPEQSPRTGDPSPRLPRPPAPTSDPSVMRVLREGTLEVLGRLVEASNATLYCRASGRSADGSTVDLPCVYKPVRGERPLWDFPDGTLANREVAAFLVSDAMGLSIPPPTVLRDGPFGRGMVQLWVEVDERVDVMALVRRCDDRLRRIALFDAVVNNTDRKGGHLLPVRGGHIYGVDHGICFAVEPKLRTILWCWSGAPIDQEERAVLARVRAGLRGELGSRLRELLSGPEVRATARRIDGLLSGGQFPEPDPERPAVPWPPF